MANYGYLDFSNLDPEGIRKKLQPAMIDLHSKGYNTKKIINWVNEYLLTHGIEAMNHANYDIVEGVESEAIGLDMDKHI